MESVLPDAFVPVIAAAMLAIVWAAEGFAPLLAGRGHRARRGARNLTLGFLNGGARGLLLPPALLAVTLAAAHYRIGMLHVLALPSWAALIAAIILLDLWQYLSHRLWHKLPILWRFHVVHHHDPEVDTTTAARFHTGEILISGAALLLAVPLFGLTLPQIAMFELILVCSAIFHHGNFAVPARLDRALQLVIVTPSMHLVHHSRWELETDSNYSAVFSIWDRLFGTFCMERDVHELELGLDGYATSETDTLKGMLMTPVGPVKSQRGRAPGWAGILQPDPHWGEGSSAIGIAQSGETALATSSTHPKRGRQLPLPLAVASR